MRKLAFSSLIIFVYLEYLVAQSCPPGYSLGIGSIECYRLGVEASVDWAQAQVKCSEVAGGTLVNIKSLEENTFLNDLSKANKWIGFRYYEEDGKWEWNEDPSNQNSFSNWQTIEQAGESESDPDGKDPNHNDATDVFCGALIYSTNQISDRSCSSTAGYGYVCQAPGPPTSQPTGIPSTTPTNSPSTIPTSKPMSKPTRIPSVLLTSVPSVQPIISTAPTRSSLYTDYPTSMPSNEFSTNILKVSLFVLHSNENIMHEKYVQSLKKTIAFGYGDAVKVEGMTVEQSLSVSRRRLSSLQYNFEVDIKTTITSVEVSKSPDPFKLEQDLNFQLVDYINANNATYMMRQELKNNQVEGEDDIEIAIIGVNSEASTVDTLMSETGALIGFIFLIILLVCMCCSAMYARYYYMKKAKEMDDDSENIESNQSVELNDIFFKERLDLGVSENISDFNEHRLSIKSHEVSQSLSASKSDCTNISGDILDIPIPRPIANEGNGELREAFEAAKKEFQRLKRELDIREREDGNSTSETSIQNCDKEQIPKEHTEAS